ncbi:hypothetical protein [Agromyces kandeliae]|uniref:Uncharacterized protein n=1 Tax=Agromyces kandeliae TaxID=2666141 RepID=A0A6L5R3E5_9MICO|nr:hypothetical protein [Agromyces kandeliae]MRX44571.1 hypothetical protein [Agromyces kandeliae]
MSEPDEARTTDPDDVEGTYTEVEGEAPRKRTVEGEYTRRNGVEEDESVVGDYTSTEEHPEVHEASEEHGDYARSEGGHPKPHPGLHKG